MSEVTVTRAGETLDRLLWRERGDAAARLVERTLDLNPGLARPGPVLPLGTVIRLPEAQAVRPAAVTPIRLW